MDSVLLQQEIIFVTETWKDDRIPKSYKLDGYKSAFANGINAKGKGVGVFFKRDGLIEICEEDKFQFIKFKTGAVSIFVCTYQKAVTFTSLLII